MDSQREIKWIPFFMTNTTFTTFLSQSSTERNIYATLNY